MNELDTRGLREIRNYMYYDGPIMGLYEMDGIKYLGLWADVIDMGLPTEVDIWLFAEVSIEAIVDLESNKLTTREIIEHTSSLYRGANGCHYSNLQPAVKITWTDVAEDCRPTVDSYLNSP